MNDVLIGMSEDKWWEKDFFTDERKEKGKKAGKTTAKGGVGYIAFAFFLGYLFLQGQLPFGTQVEAGFAFAVFGGLALVFAFFGIFTGVYFIFNLQAWYTSALNLAGLTAGHWLTWVGFYPIVFIGCLINWGLILFLVFMIIRWIVRKARR